MKKNKQEVINKLAMLSFVWLVAVCIAILTVIFLVKGLWMSALIIFGCEVRWILSMRWILKKI